MNDDDLTPEEQAEVDDDLNRPTIKNTDIVHYRDGEGTYLNTDWLYTDLNREHSTPTVVAWIRMLTGPENTPEGLVATDKLRAYIDREGPVFDTALDELEVIGAIEVDGDRITFPNLVWGPPPVDDDDDD